MRRPRPGERPRSGSARVGADENRLTARTPHPWLHATPREAGRSPSRHPPTGQATRRGWAASPAARGSRHGTTKMASSVVPPPQHSSERPHCACVTPSPPPRPAPAPSGPRAPPSPSRACAVSRAVPAPARARRDRRWHGEGSRAAATAPAPGRQPCGVPMEPRFIEGTAQATVALAR